MPEKASINTPLGWDVLSPHVAEYTIQPEHIDHMGHVNNAVYLTFLEDTAWSHTRALGLSWQDYKNLDAGCVVRHHALDYLAAAYESERVQVGTWITGNDHRLRLWRGYQIRRVGDGKTLLRASTEFVCVRLSNERPRRMPQAFIEAYQPTEENS